MMTILLEGQNLSVSTPHIVAGTKDYLSVEIIRGTGCQRGRDLHDERAAGLLPAAV